MEDGGPQPIGLGFDTMIKPNIIRERMKKELYIT
jgi:hypothetical protein